MPSKIQQYEKNKVFMSSTGNKVGDTIKLTYNGMLIENGADGVYAHVGYGQEWQNSAYIPMKSTDNGFEAEIEIVQNDALYVCFKDSANNWDNNSKENYLLFELKKTKKTSSAAKCNMAKCTSLEDNVDEVVKPKSTRKKSLKK